MAQYQFQNYTVASVRTAAILTGSYVAGTVLGLKNATLNNPSPSDVCLEDFNQVNILVKFTIGSLTSAEVKVEYSTDNSTYYQDTFTAYSGGTCTASSGEYSFAATGNYVISIPIKARYIKISAKGTGTATGSSMTIDAILGVV